MKYLIILVLLIGCSETTEFPEQEICNDVADCGIDYDECIGNVIGTCRQESMIAYECLIDFGCNAEECTIEEWEMQECKGIR